MKNLNRTVLAFLAFSTLAFGYEGPSPLKNIKVDFSVGFDSTKGIYTYGYKLTNPSTNDGQIDSVTMPLGTNLQTDAPLSGDGLTQCARFHAMGSQTALQKTPAVPVGSAAPTGWSCAYKTPRDSDSGAFGWHATRANTLLKPGNALNGFALTSHGLPGIRTIVVEPDINTDLLPDSYDGNLDLTIALENKVKWTGQTIGPVAPPKAFDGGNFIAYLITLVNTSRSQGWIDNDGIVNSLLAKLDTAQSNVSSDKAMATNTLTAFMNEVKAQSGKHLTSEAYALLYFNAQYAVKHM